MNTLEHRGWHSRGYLPHFDRAHAVQAITFRLGDSLPKEKLLEWERKLSADDLTIRNKVQSYLDAGHGACHLANDRVALLVQDALLHFDRERYRLLEWVIMPNHVHLIVEMNKGRSLSALLQGWKSFTSKEANRILGRKGQFWEPEYYDRYIRSETHYFVAVRYLRENPVRAKLCRRPEEWRFSSAYETFKVACSEG